MLMIILILFGVFILLNILREILVVDRINVGF